MKEVIIQKKTNTISTINVLRDKCYGIYYNYNKGFIYQESYRYGNYKTLARTDLTMGNSWTCLQYPLLIDIVEAAIEMGFKVYEFDTPQELFKWLSE